MHYLHYLNYLLPCVLINMDKSKIGNILNVSDCLKTSYTLSCNLCYVQLNFNHIKKYLQLTEFNKMSLTIIETWFQS